MPVDPELQALLTLHLVPGLGPRLTAALMERFGSALGALRAGPGEFRRVPHVGDKLAHDLHQALRDVDVSAESDMIARHQVHLYSLGSAEYSKTLAQIFDPPHLLYVKGSLIGDDAKAVAIVGSRQCTSYRRRMAQRLATGLAHKGYTVISGLARGIDGAAHRAAFKAGGRTLVALARGHFQVHPPGPPPVSPGT